jgi:hypothetical protein
VLRQGINQEGGFARQIHGAREVAVHQRLPRLAEEQSSVVERLLILRAERSRVQLCQAALDVGVELDNLTAQLAPLLGIFAGFEGGHCGFSGRGFGGRLGRLSFRGDHSPTAANRCGFGWFRGRRSLNGFRGLGRRDD